MIKDMDKVYLDGKMVKCMMVNGPEENSMELVFTKPQTKKSHKEENGKMARKLDGWKLLNEDNISLKK
jgi:hypothetical protein